jgi:hypothetical protein
MRTLQILVLIIFPILTSGQNNRPVIVVVNSSLKASFDSIFIHPSSIDSLHIDNQPNMATIYIQTKNPVWKYKSIKDILKPYSLYPYLVTYKTLTPAFYVDDKPIIKITDAKIDEAYFAEVIFKDLSIFKNIEIPCKNIVVVDIRLYLTEKIRIRGDTIQNTDSYLKTK